MLMKLTAGINFTSSFLVLKYFSKFFFYLQFGFGIFHQKNISTKDAHNMLVKLTIHFVVEFFSAKL